MDFKKRRMLIKIQRFIVELIQIIVGSALMAFGIAVFLLPNQLSSGGFSGIATIVYYLFNFPLGTTILILNIPLFILAFFKVGKRFCLNGMIGTLLLSVFLDLFERGTPLTNDRLLACIYGGIIVGIGNAIILKANASTGGSDLLANIIRKYKPDVRAGSLIVIIDIIIVTLNVYFFKEIEIGLYSAIVIYIMGKIIDIFFEGIFFTKMMFIISPKYSEISDRINKEIGRGTTCLYGKGMYKEQEKNILLCVASRGETIEIRKLIKKIDASAFVIIANAREVFGKGFKKE